MYVNEIANLLLFIKSIKQPSDEFDYTTDSTRSVGTKLFPKATYYEFLFSSLTWVVEFPTYHQLLWISGEEISLESF